MIVTIVGRVAVDAGSAHTRTSMRAYGEDVWS